MIEWFTFSCTGCGARLILDKDVAPTHCDSVAARVDGIGIKDADTTNGAGLAFFDGNALRGLLDGREPGYMRPLSATTIVSHGGVIQLTRAEHQTLVEMAMYDLLHRGPNWEIVDGALARLQRMLLSRVEIGSIRREVDRLSFLLGEKL